jgi:hypothetical protein
MQRGNEKTSYMVCHANGKTEIMVQHLEAKEAKDCQ